MTKAECDHFIKRLDECVDESELTFVARDISESKLLDEAERERLRTVYKECLIACIVYEDRMHVDDKVKRLEVLRGKGSEQRTETDVRDVSE